MLMQISHYFLPTVFVFPRPFTVNWLHINENYSRAKGNDSVNIRKPVFYSTLVLYLQAVHGYASAVDPEQFASELKKCFSYLAVYLLNIFLIL